MFGLTTKKQAEIAERAAAKRGYAAAAKKARYGDFKSSRGSADYELREGLVQIRNKARYLARNSSVMRRFLLLLSINVVGPNGFIFQSRVRRLSGDMDDSLNKRVEADFKRWSKRPTVCGKLSMIDLQKQAVKTLARDGEVIWEIVYGSKYKDGVAINPIEADYLDETLNTNHDNNNQIKMGVEIDQYGAPVAYHFLTSHPGDQTWWSHQNKRRYRRVAADRIIHTYVSDRPGQTRGEPWAATIINNVKMLDGYREAEITHRRLKSSIMGFFKRVLPGPQGIEELADGVDEADDILEMTMEPGLLKELAPGLEFQGFDPGGAQTDYESFEGQIKKDTSMGLMISNMSLGMETSGVSYSAGRTISLEDRDFYKDIQGFMSNRKLEPIFELWLSRRVLSEDSMIPPTRLDVIRDNAVFRARGWDWVDPGKEVKAGAEALLTGQTSLPRLLGLRGIDEDELLDEIEATKRKLEKRGLTLCYNEDSQETDQSPTNEDDEDDGKDTD